MNEHKTTQPDSPMTSAVLICVENQASSPNLPNLYLERRKSFGKPHATDTNRGRGLVLGSISVENPLRSALDKYRDIDCIITFHRISRSLSENTTQHKRGVYGHHRLSLTPFNQFHYHCVRISANY